MVLNAPFADLRRRLPPAPEPVTARAAKTATRTGEPADDPSLFAHAMAGVVPLQRGLDARIDGPAPASNGRPLVSEEAEALAVLSDLVRGASRFDVTETREYVEGSVVGLDPRLVRRLRRGDFAWQQHIDLHGETADAARQLVQRFLLQAVRDGVRCVLIVHGRGLNSKDREPVLKERLKKWLSTGPNARLVLAFATARPSDGGAGALYVLLRRDRRRLPIRVTEGSAQ